MGRQRSGVKNDTDARSWNWPRVIIGSSRKLNAPQLLKYLDLVWWEYISNTAFQPVARLREKVAQAGITIPFTDLTWLVLTVNRTTLFQNCFLFLLETYLAQVVLSSENFKKSIRGFRSVSGMEPPKSVKRVVELWPAELTKMKQRTVNSLKGEVPNSSLLHCDRVLGDKDGGDDGRKMLFTHHLNKQFLVKWIFNELEGHVNHLSHEWIIVPVKMSWTISY